jgi:hypothetical protein
MRLKAPVDYWRAKAASHESKSGIYRNVAAIYAVVIVCCTISIIYWLSHLGLELVARVGSQPYALLFIGVTGLTLASLLLWTERILVKLYLSEHHLAIDARERETMAQTYLALTADKAATDEDRVVVLSALFRPTADGVVKDDAAPDLSVPALLSKILDKR